ncbi:MAG: PEP/pyruvate-binding domain-containing protein, partial [Fimbriimonadales bacterium]
MTEELSFCSPHATYTKRLAAEVALSCREETGCTETVLSPEEAAAPCLEPRHVQQLARIALLLERHFGGPQDIEWAVDDSGEVVLLQTRPLRVSRPAAAAG